MLQLAPEIEVKMELDLGKVDTKRDHDIQTHKEAVFAEFKRRLEKAFPEGFRIHTLEFGVDTGWHDELRGDSGDEPVIT